jgi:hypothetical protein
MLQRSLDDLDQLPESVMPYSVDDLEDLDEDILSTFLSRPRSPPAIHNSKPLNNAVTKVELEVCSRGIVFIESLESDVDHPYRGSRLLICNARKTKLERKRAVPIRAVLPTHQASKAMSVLMSRSHLRRKITKTIQLQQTSW